MSIHAESNIRKKFAEKQGKHQDLRMEIEKMRQVEATIHSVIIGSTGLMLKETVQQSEHFGVQTYMYLLQQALILQTCNVTPRFLNQTI